MSTNSFSLPTGTWTAAPGVEDTIDVPAIALELSLTNQGDGPLTYTTDAASGTVAPGETVTYDEPAAHTLHVLSSGGGDYSLTGSAFVAP